MPSRLRVPQTLGEQLRPRASYAQPPRAAFLSRSSPSRHQSSITHHTARAELPTAPTEKRHGRNHSRRPWRVPALGLFAFGLPAGWALSQYNASEEGVAEPTQFVKYTLVSKEEVSSTCSIFALRPATTIAIADAIPGSECAITSVEFKQPQLQIVRSYTCLPPRVGQEEDELRFLIRKERGGEVSNFIHRLPIGAQVEIRGPHLEYAIPEDVRSAIFIAGGTGIAPALQAADVLDGEADLHILWATRRREDCIGGANDTPAKASFWTWWSRPQDLARTAHASSDLQIAEKGAIVAQLELLKRSFAASTADKRRLAVDYFVDEEGRFVDRAHVKNILADQGRTGGDAEARRRIIFVSGPAGFIDFWAGPKQWIGGREIQGPLGGVLSSLDLEGWEVVKL